MVGREFHDQEADDFMTPAEREDARRRDERLTVGSSEPGVDEAWDTPVNAHGIPIIATTPTTGDRPRRGAHSAPKPTWRERRADRKERVRARRTVFGRHPKSTVLLVLFLAMTPIWVSVGQAATNPSLGNTVGARVTEWVRGHGGGGLVTWAENVWYTWNAPPKGGKPAKGAIPAAPTRTTVPVATGPAHLAAPAAIVPLASSPIAGEGQWHPLGRTVDGIPAMYAAYLRPNNVYTSLVTGVAWMDTKLLSATLYAGSSIPGTGQTFANTAPIAGPALDTLDAAFNSGFRMQDSYGGFYLDGIEAIPLVPGAASMVIYKDGTVAIGAWGTDVTMRPDVVAVRQNLALIANGGQPVAGLDANDNHRWGNTLGGAVHVWRSGVGITATGALVYAGGSGLSIVDLADVLTRAGAVRAMEMDINTSWVNFFSWPVPMGAPATGATGVKLTNDMVNSPYRYFNPCSRDFFTMSVRAVAVPLVTKPGSTSTASHTSTSTTAKG